jgi:aldose 1-epimerase
MAEVVRLTAGELSVELVPAVGGAVKSYRWRDRPVFRNGPDGMTDANTGGSYPLVPFSNRVRDGRFSFRGREVRLSPNLPPQKHPLHGQGWRGEWRIEAAEERRAVLVHDHAPGEWPWAWQGRQTFELDEGGLTTGLSCRNDGDAPMPCGLGFHPYFPADAETVLDTVVAEVWTIDAEVMPVERVAATGRYDLRERRIEGVDLDNGYGGWSGRTELRQRDHTVVISSAEARYFQVYAPPEGGIVVAEPVTHANAALNAPEDQFAGLGLQVLDPGQTATLSARFEVIPR